MADWQDKLNQYKTAPDKNYAINAYDEQQPQTTATGAPQTMSAMAAPQGNMQIPMASGGASQQTAPQRAAQQGVSTPQFNTPGYQNGQNVDLTSLYSEIGASKPNQQWTLQDLQNKMAADPVNGQKVDLSGLATSLGKKPGDTFTSDDLNTSIGNANSIPIQAAKYQDPAQFQALITQMNQVLSPLTQAQKGAAQNAYGQASGQLADKWAANGLLASGGAAAQQQYGANQLSQQMQGIEAQQQANALPLAQQFANLSLNEDQQKFNQNNTRAQQNVGNVANALGQQYGQQNAWMGQAQNLAGMDIGQNQWSQQFGAQNKQNAVNNQLSGLGLQQNMLQDYLKNYMGTTGMDIGQNQWSQDFGMRKQAQDFSQQMAQAQMGSENQKFNANLGQQQNQQAQQGSQFDRNFGQGQDQFNQTMGLQNKQANGNMAMQLSQLFGKGVNPTTEWGNMFDQVNGAPTLAAQQGVMGQLDKVMQYTPFTPQGAGNVAAQNPAYSSLQDMLNNIGGNPSQRTYDSNLLSQYHMQQNDIRAQANDIRAQANNIRAGQVGEQGAMRHLQQQKMMQDMEQHATTQGAKTATNQALSDLSIFTSKDEAKKYLAQHQNALLKNGVDIKAMTNYIHQTFPDKKPAAAAGNSPFGSLAP